MSAVSVLDEGGVLHAANVVAIAAVAGLELAAAATLLVKESSGGHNVWGHDAVIVAPDTYVKGGPVTRSSYTAYITAVKAGRAGRQGCGPTQLTYGPFQQRADDAGGCCAAHVILSAGEMRTADVQGALAALAARVEELHKGDGLDADVIRQAVDDALAGRP